MSETTSPRRIKIGSEERTGWSSDRPRDGAVRAPQHANARVLNAERTMTYSPRSLIVVSAADTDVRDRLLRRLFETKILLSVDRVKAMLAGRVPAAHMDETAQQLFSQALTKRLTAGRPVVVETLTLAAAERERLTAVADACKRSAHLMVLDTGRKALGNDELFYEQQALTQLARSGEVGAEGFRTVLVLGRSDVDALRQVEFVAPRQR